MSEIKTRKRVKVIGMLDPRCLYSTAAAYRYGGIGPKDLSKGRAAGILHPTYHGNYAMYDGEELIALLKWLHQQNNGK